MLLQKFAVRKGMPKKDFCCCLAQGLAFRAKGEWLKNRNKITLQAAPFFIQKKVAFQAFCRFLPWNEVYDA